MSFVFVFELELVMVVLGVHLLDDIIGIVGAASDIFIEVDEVLGIEIYLLTVVALEFMIKDLFAILRQIFCGKLLSIERIRRERFRIFLLLLNLEIVRQNMLLLLVLIRMICNKSRISLMVRFHEVLPLWTLYCSWI